MRGRGRSYRQQVKDYRQGQFAEDKEAAKAKVKKLLGSFGGKFAQKIADKVAKKLKETTGD